MSQIYGILYVYVAYPYTKPFYIERSSMKQSKSILHTLITSLRCGKDAFLCAYLRFSHLTETKPLPTTLCVAAILNLLIEMLSRHSPIDGFAYLLLHPYLFFVNTVILFFTLSLSFLFARRSFALVLLSIGWLVLGITNCVILSMRNTPLAAIDFGLITSCLDIIPIYLRVPEIILIILAFLIVLLLLFFLFRATTVLKKPYFSRLRGFCAVAVFGALLTVLLVFSSGIGAIETTFADLPGAYDDFGFPYCFSLSVLDRGVDKPDDYSDDRIDEILSAIETTGTENRAPTSDTATVKEDTAVPTVPSASPSDGDTPNIIFVQLESFFDVNRLANITFSDNPTPVFTALKASCSSGYLTVPAIGAGTANTEFEVLTGMNLDDFGAGEYPYKTVLQKQTTESVAFNLRACGYTAHAIHNNTATFYERNKVYSSLGFDTFTSIEYMANAVYNPLGWAKDVILTDAILNCLQDTPSSDFIFAISVQPHGRYPDEEASEHEDAYDTSSDTGTADQRIDVFGIDDSALLAQYRYYVNQLYETDAFIGALVSSLSAFDEKTVVVFWGDHLPCFDYTAEDLCDGTTPFETEYVIWSNFEMEQKTEDLSTYQLSAAVLDRLDIHEGIITRLHQSCAEEPDYLSSLEMLEYDMLYGEMDVWHGINPHLPTVLQMGIDPITVTDLRHVGTSLYVFGAHFTPFSRIKIDDDICDTVYIDSDTLLVPDLDTLRYRTVSVVQYSSDGVMLSESNRLRYTPDTNSSMEDNIP